MVMVMVVVVVVVLGVEFVKGCMDAMVNGVWCTLWALR